jgi:beta-aspartyl-peptidase (threonine type)
MNVSFTPTLVVHGGAWEIPPEDRQAHIDGCRGAAAAGWAILEAGGSALDAVEEAVRQMESDPTFDAGRGAFLNAAGVVELDAIIMDGRTLDLGAVAAIQHIQHPVSLARLVMTESKHAFLAGRGAEAFAREHDVPICPQEALLVGRELKRWRDLQEGGALPDYFTPQDTVGAVALDQAGNVAAATSTGGTPNKLPGRVGDSPLVGSGAYADNHSAAASATGLGEALMKIVISKTACDRIEMGQAPQPAAEAVMKLLTERTDGQGGIIILDRQGRYGIAHTTSYIAHAVVTEGGKVEARIRR